MILKLESLRDLQEAMGLVSWLGRPTVQSVRVTLDWVEEADRQRLAERVRFLFNDCGCVWGGPAFLVAFTAFFVPSLMAGAFSWSLLGAAFLLGLVGALVGKILGLAWSYRQLRALLAQMMPPGISSGRQASQEVST
jgi:hypothetical protein